MDHDEFIKFVFYGLISLVSMYCASQLKEAKDSIQGLNEKLAALIEKMMWHEKKIDEHSERIKTLETKEN